MTEQRSAGGGCDRPRVLLAEDNQTNQMAAVRMLEMLGYQVDVAVNGVEAVDACRKVEYGIVLMDNQMPEMDGLTAAREVRTFELAEGKPPVPIIALTADAMQGDREKCLAAGMNDYLAKPFKVVQLGEMLERWSHPRSTACAPDAGTSPQQEDAIDSSVFDDFTGAGTDGGPNDFVIRLIDQYLAESTSRMAALKDAARHHDATAMRAATHSLKGTSGTVGAKRMAHLCDDLEKIARASTLDGAPAVLEALEHEFTRVHNALKREKQTAQSGVAFTHDDAVPTVRALRVWHGAAL